MKFFYLYFSAIVVGSLAAFVTNKDQSEKVSKIGKLCRDEVGLTNQEFTMFLNGADTDSELEMKIKKNILCIFKKTGFISETGDINVRALKTRLETAASDREADEIVQKCALRKSRAEDTAYGLLWCLFDQRTRFSPVE